MTDQDLIDFCHAIESAAVKLRMALEKPKPSDLLMQPNEVVRGESESTFLVLKFTPQKGQRIGAFDVAFEPHNQPSIWDHAYKVLQMNNASINSRLHPAGYQYSYWLFGQHKIYRQLPKTEK